MYRFPISNKLYPKDILQKARHSINMSKFWSNMAKRTKPYVPGEQVQATDIIKLNTNENPYPPSPKVTSAIQEVTNRNLRLYPSPTMDALKESIAAYYEQIGRASCRERVKR